jgi:ribosome-binding factor A
MSSSVTGSKKSPAPCDAYLGVTPETIPVDASFKSIMRHQSLRAPTQRQLRVGEVIRHALAEIIQRGDVHDPALEGKVITVPEVRMAADLKCATVYVMPLGGEGRDEVVAAFDRNKKYLRGEIARRVNLRNAPELRFRVDESFDTGDKVDALLRSPEVARDLNGHKPGNGSSSA